MSTLAVLPSVEAILAAPANQKCIALWGHQAVKLAVRELQHRVRDGHRASGKLPEWAETADGYAPYLKPYLIEKYGQGLRRVFNLSGTLLHTNLGRALLSNRMANAGLAAATHPVTLEFDLATGKRGERDKLVEELLCTLTGAEAATVVNNNAAALLLVLNTLALNSSVPVSRGELIEIGGSFRLPDLITRAGCNLQEIGTTNRTHESDYRAAINESTALLLKIHPSNYHIEGFTKEVSIPRLAEVARDGHLPLCVDLGSGALVELSRYGLPREPTVRQVLAQGADLVTFSGDKLLGSVQAGIIVGRREWVERLRRNPLKRALRCDKITLGILAETLKIYQEPDALTEQVPLLGMLARPLESIHATAKDIAQALAEHLVATGQSAYKVDIRSSQCQVGSGAAPAKAIESVAVCIQAESASQATRMMQRLRALPIPVIARLTEGVIWLDLRCLTSAEESQLLVNNLAALAE